MAAREVLDVMEPLVYERERQEFALGDTLDIKTGLILAALTFLAIQSGELIHSGLSLSQHVAQYVSVAALIIGGCFAAIELYPIDYDREATPDKYFNWLETVRDTLAGKAEANFAEQVAEARIKRAMKRVNNNLAANKRKSKWMIASFFCALLSFAANILTLTIRLLS
jgi:hypothetical protein